MRNSRVAVFHVGGSEPSYHTKYGIAAGWVARGLAEFIDSRSVRLIAKQGPISSSERTPASKQGRVYHVMANTKHRSVFQGGLVRTEHQPARVSPPSGAKVGHQ